MKRNKRFVTGYDLSRRRLEIMSEERAEQLKAQGAEAQPLLSNEALLEEIREVLVWLPVALEIYRYGHENQFVVSPGDLHVIGHLVALCLCFRYKNLLYAHQDSKGVICSLLMEMGI
jgi:hypothetical protein